MLYIRLQYSHNFAISSYNKSHFRACRLLHSIVLPAGDKNDQGCSNVDIH